jgi:hypothetical protein
MIFAMHTEPLDVVPLWALFVIESALLWAVMEAGYRLGTWRHMHRPDERDQPVGAMVASILGLVALVLGFTFSLAASRFDARRTAVLDEANAIGTTYLRARLLPEPARTETMKLLREYVEVRLAGVQGGDSEAAIARSEKLHELLWAQAAAAAAKNEASVMTSVYIQSLNNVIDMHAKRVMVGIRSRIPLVIWAGLFGLSLLGLAAVGYQAGLTTTRRSPAMVALVFAFSMVLLMIADLDRGQEGLLQVGQQAMIDVQRSMQPASESGQSR